MDNILEVRNLTKQYADFTLDMYPFQFRKERLWG